MRREEDLVELTPAHDTPRPRPRRPADPGRDPSDRRAARQRRLAWLFRALSLAAAAAVWVPALYWREKIEQSMGGPQPVTAAQLAAATDPKALPRYAVITPDPAAVTDTGLRFDYEAEWGTRGNRTVIHDKMLLIDLGGKAVLAEVPQSFPGGTFVAEPKPLDNPKHEFFTQARKKYAHLGDRLQPFVLCKTDDSPVKWAWMLLAGVAGLSVLIGSIGFQYRPGSAAEPAGKPTRVVAVFRR